MALELTTQPTTDRLTPMEVTPMQLTVLDRGDDQDALSSLAAMTTRVGSGSCAPMPANSWAKVGMTFQRITPTTIAARKYVSGGPSGGDSAVPCSGRLLGGGRMAVELRDPSLGEERLQDRPGRRMP